MGFFEFLNPITGKETWNWWFFWFVSFTFLIFMVFSSIISRHKNNGGDEQETILTISNFNPIALLGLVGFLGIIGPIMGKATWFFWISWFTWFSFYTTAPDERFLKNLSKAGLPSFVITWLGFTVLFFMKDSGMSQDIIYSSIDFFFTIGFLSFVFVLKYFEVYGE